MNAEVHEEIPKLDESNHSVTVNKTIKVQDEQVPTKLLLNILFIKLCYQYTLNFMFCYLLYILILNNISIIIRMKVIEMKIWMKISLSYQTTIRF